MGGVKICSDYQIRSLLMLILFVEILANVKCFGFSALSFGKFIIILS